MKGFFYEEGRSAPTKKTAQSRTEKVPRQRQSTKPSLVEGCEACGLYESCNSPKMPFTGQGRMKILIVAEAPGQTEDDRGIQLIGKAGQFLRERLQRVGIDLERDCWKTNAIICRPPKNRTPTRKEIKLCYPNLKKTLEDLKPRFVWLLGAVALQSFFFEETFSFTNIPFRSLVGQCIPSYKFDCWVVPLFHPSYVLRIDDGILPEVFDAQLSRAMSFCSLNPPVKDDARQYVRMLLDFDSVKDALEQVQENKRAVVVDIETNRLRPYVEGSKIFTIGMSQSVDDAFAFPVGSWYWKVPSEEATIRTIVLNILRDRDIPKYAHNSKFEDAWFRTVWEAPPILWEQCTMNLQHLLDSRPKLTGLKTQVFLRWGCTYADTIEPYLGDADEAGFNSIHKAPLDELLLYNGLDALYEYRLLVQQLKELRSKWLQDPPILDIVMDGLEGLVEAEVNGIHIDLPYYTSAENKLTLQVDTLTSELVNSPEARLFEQQVGRELKLGSSKDLIILLYEILGLRSVKTTVSGRPSVDEDALRQINNPFVDKLLRLRKFLKLRDTYLAQFTREQFSGKIHPSFDLHTAETGRGSSSNPNFQNIPNRDVDAREVTRRGIVAPPGFFFSEVDYSSIEVRIMACYSKDPALIRYIEDPTTDMHRDQAMDIFILSRDEVIKPIRHIGKNGFVFPQFYGDWYKACAKNCWEMAEACSLADGTLLRRHLSKKGIGRLSQFEEHMKGVEKRFWERLHYTHEWRQKVVQDYLKTGYVENFFGFRRHGYLSRNQVMNSPIQGTAFQCLLWAYPKVMWTFRRCKMHSRLIGQIHDSICSYCHRNEKAQFKDIARTIMCDKLRAAFDWIIVPLEVEFSFSPDGGSWADCKGESDE